MYLLLKKIKISQLRTRLMAVVALAGLIFITIEPTLAYSDSKSHQKYWLFLKNKGPESLKKPALVQIEESLSDKARVRRAKVLPQGALVDSTDLPVWPSYIQQLQAAGFEPVHQSKWLNAVSVYAGEQQLDQVKQLSFVSHYRKVARAEKRLPILLENNRIDKNLPVSSFYNFDYGQSLVQNDIINIPGVHDLGVYGQGVLIAVFDSGFRLEHEVFDNLRSRVLAQYDFVNKDQVVDNEEDQDVISQNYHGSQVLAILGGFKEGQLIGPAFAADFILAKTEDIPTETQAEEDNWIAAAEWAENLGADIINSSVGYLDWYTYEDMDGQTAPITIAADLAVKKGIVVVTSAGNEGNKSWRYVTAPADGKEVIAVGAVSSNGSIASYSSLGPTFDGRIKPDVVAMGTYNVSISLGRGKDGEFTYSSVLGTSFSSPLVAGTAALILSAHPDLTPVEVRECLIQTSDRFFSPDNVYGYGLVNALAAIQYKGDPPIRPTHHKLTGCYPNPFIVSQHAVTRIGFELAESIELKIEIYNILGQKIKTLWNGQRIGGPNQRFFWDGRDYTGRVLSSGVYLCRMQAGNVSETIKMTLFH